MLLRVSVLLKGTGRCDRSLEEQETKTSSYLCHLLVNYTVLAEGKVLGVTDPGGNNGCKGKKGSLAKWRAQKGGEGSWN